MKKSIFLTVLLAAFFVSAAIASPGDTLWTRTYGGSDTDYGRCVQQTTDGGYVITGQTKSFGAGYYDMYLIKTDVNGDTLWTRTHGGTEFDVAEFVQQTDDGGYIIVGNTASFGAGLNDVYVTKTDANGDTLWTRTYGGTSADRGFSVQQTSDGGYIIAGNTESFGAGGQDCYLVKTDANGDTLWTRTYGGSVDDYAEYVEQTNDGGYIIAGVTESFGAGGEDFYLVKTDADGDTLWTRTYGGSNSDIAYSGQQTDDGGYIIVGQTGSWLACDVWLVKTDATGDTLWTRRYNRSSSNVAYSGQQTDDGGYIITGYTGAFGSGFDVYLIKTDATGDTLWTRTYGGLGSGEIDYGRSVRQTDDGGYIVAGETSSFGAGGFDVYLLKVAGEAPEPDVSIEIVPDDPPVTVPQGERFGFTGSLTNNTEDPQVSDAWTMAVGPQKETYGPFKMRNDVALEPFETRTADFSQRVPNLAPLGFYDYIAYCGDYPSTVMDSSFFQVEVIAGASGGGEDIGWVLTGSFSEGEFTDLPSEFALLSNYPNPFNARTVIDYQLPVTSSVKLEVYNILGEKVVTLVDEEQEAGYRSVTWDASEIASGIYFYKLIAGDYTATKRMMLVK